MDPVEHARGYLLVFQVMAGDGEIGLAQGRQAADIDIGGQDPPPRSFTRLRSAWATGCGFARRQ
jgi:hypothetical protein